MFLQLLVGVMDAYPGLSVVATAQTAQRGVDMCLQHRPDLLILDLLLPDQSGQVVAEAMIKANPDGRLIVLSAQASSFVCPTNLQPALHAVVDKTEAFETLGAEISALLIPEQGPRLRLTTRETEVLYLIGQGLSNMQISESLRLSVHTVETHRRNLSGKLGLKGAELVRYAALQSLAIR